VIICRSLLDSGIKYSLLYLLIQSTNNKVHGTGNILGSITFSDATAELEVSLSGEIMNNISLNGGTLTLQNNLSFINNKIIININNTHTTCHSRSWDLPNSFLL